MKMWKKILIGIVVIVAIGVEVLFYMSSNRTEYDFDTDKVASINAVLGEKRRVTGVHIGTSDSSKYKQYTYKTESMEQDLATYIQYLRNNGWLVIRESHNLTTGGGERQLRIESADSGKILTMSIVFEQGKYAIRITKSEGRK